MNVVLSKIPRVTAAQYPVVTGSVSRDVTPVLSGQYLANIIKSCRHGPLE